VGTFGDGALFSFQTLKPLNAYGGGLALVRDAAVARRVRELASSLPWPSDDRILARLRVGNLQRLFTSPGVFTATAFPILWAASWFDWNPDVYLWEPIRRLDPLPSSYAERFSNVQAAIGLAGLERLDDWTTATRDHARKMDAALKDLPGVQTPRVPPHFEHVYYQYCVYTPDRDAVVTRCIRHGVDLETLHVDVCSRLPLFDEFQTSAPGAERSEQAIQVPVYASLNDEQIRRIATTVRRVLTGSRS
jgi:dTDP-4-amino-4,6-dideoxygalactose transaminase